VLAISMRRARLMGLDTCPAGYAGFDTDDDPSKVRLEIVNNPEIEQVSGSKRREPACLP
jgi:hypothetical protein